MKKRIVLIAMTVALVVSLSVLLISVPSVDAATLRQGSRGTEVKTVQTKLKSWGYYSGSADGIYGAKTVTAVKSFQKKNGLTADGIVGNATAKKMGITLGGGNNGGTTNKPNSNGSGDLYLIARCIYGEARGEPYNGKVAVAAVILNRVKSSKFPNTISGVIYQPWAFTAVNDGQINMGTNDECLRAAQDALNGWDPTYGCIYYYNPKTATNQWIRSRKIITTIGRHVFCV